MNSPKLLTVQASFPYSPPAQIKLVVSSRNDAPSRVAAKELWQVAAGSIGTSTSFWIVW